MTKNILRLTKKLIGISREVGKSYQAKVKIASADKVVLTVKHKAHQAKKHKAHQPPRLLLLLVLEVPALPDF